MNTGLVSSRYALALYDFTKKNHTEDKIYAEAKVLVKSFVKYSHLKSALANPVLSKKEKKELIVKSIGGTIQPTFEKFIDLLLENKRESHIQTIALKYIDLYRERKNIYSGKLTTATEIDNTTEKKLVAVIEKKTNGTLEVEKNVDSGILGGFIFEINSERWDASVAGQLSRIKKGYMGKKSKNDLSTFHSCYNLFCN
jgi:F-type H+-transporting ATPase subunit delta